MLSLAVGTSPQRLLPSTPRLGCPILAFALHVATHSTLAGHIVVGAERGGQGGRGAVAAAAAAATVVAAAAGGQDEQVKEQVEEDEESRTGAKLKGGHGARRVFN